MRRRCGFVKRIDSDRAKHAERHGERLLERRAAFRLLDVMRERRPWQIDVRTRGFGRGALGLRAADRRDLAFAARDALRRLVQIADRALAADRAVIIMPGLCADPFGEQRLRRVVTPAQEIDDVERVDICQERRAGIVGRAFSKPVQEQRQRFEALRDLGRPDR